MTGHFLHSRRSEDLDTHTGRGDFNLDLFIVQFALSQEFAKTLPRRPVAFVPGHLLRFAVPLGTAIPRGRQQDIQHLLFGRVFRPGLDFFYLLLPGHFYGHIGQVANNGIHFSSNVSDLGEFGGFHFDEGRLGQPGQPSRNFSLADTGRTDHEDIFGRNLIAQLFADLAATPTIAQRNSDRPLGVVLPDDVFIQLFYDLSGCH